MAKNLVFAGGDVFATTREASKAAAFADRGIKGLVADWTDRGTLCSLPPVEQILISVSYDRQSDHSRYDSQVGGLANLLDVVSPEARICYISTTGVYHQTDGGWVDEDSPAEPNREGGKVHLQAEQLLGQRRSKTSTTILRLAGIYGPGRVPRAADVMAGRPIASPPEGFLNLIHVDDAAETVTAAWSSPNRGLYLVCDDHPVIRGDFYREVARQCGAAMPEFVAPASDAPVRMRSESNKRVSNRRMKEDLVNKLQYPSYREGLADVLSQQT